MRGFDAKADEYVTKPVVPETLVARLRAVLRLAVVARAGHFVRLGAVEVDLRRGSQNPLRVTSRNVIQYRNVCRGRAILAF